MGDRDGESLSEAYDLVMFDLDGVVYVDGHAVPRAPESIEGSNRAFADTSEADRSDGRRRVAAGNRRSAIFRSRTDPNANPRTGLGPGRARWLW